MQPRKKYREPGPPISNRLVQCMRLRQASDHVLLLEECMKRFHEEGDLDTLSAELERIQSSKGKVKKDPSSSSDENEFPGSCLYDIGTELKRQLDDVLASYSAGCVECFATETDLYVLPVRLQSVEIHIYLLTDFLSV